MNQPEAELAATLRQRLSIITDEASRRNPEQHVAKLKSISERIALLHEKLPRPVDAQLAHFLARCSYAKALAYLEAELWRRSVTADATRQEQRRSQTAAKESLPNESKAPRSTAR